MSEHLTENGSETPVTVDPRALLAEFANSSDEWVRLLVSEVISTGRAVETSVVDRAYDLFRQEKGIDERTLPVVDELSTEGRQDESVSPLSLERLSEVRGVNALVTGEVIEPHEGLTILYGENGTGKTGYSRIFKALADSRTADEVLGDIEAEETEDQAAKVEYRVGAELRTLLWEGERAVPPFTRMSIFDSPSVSTHVDEELDYVYVPAALALFNHVIAGIQAVSARIEAAISELDSGASSLLSRFPKSSSIYPMIETLGASTDLAELKAKASTDTNVDEALDGLRQAVAALESNTLAAQVTVRKRDERVLEQALESAEMLAGLDAHHFNQTLQKRAELRADYDGFRKELFAAADLPTEPDDTWAAFIAAGEQYRQHLIEVDAHDAERCLYCRQTLSTSAHELLAKYSSYLEDKISADIRAAEKELATTKQSIEAVSSSEVAGLVAELSASDDKPDFFGAMRSIEETRLSVATAVENEQPIDLDQSSVAAHRTTLQAALSQARTDVENLEEQSGNRTNALAEKRVELTELEASAELARSWTTIQSQVKHAKEADRLKRLKKSLPKMSRDVTDLSKSASDQLINQSFDALFLEECTALRAPLLKVQFVGKEGKAQRRKVLNGQHKPSKVLSEGEQKVLALADFLAEARLAGITAPVVFDDPVSSLDHRRINEVARRIASLAEENQVIVFTHDIFLATTLLSLFERSKRCSYFQVTDEDGRGKVTRATGPRWDSLGNIKANINRTIQAAQQQEGEARDALVRTGYGWIRAWCEVFTETELLQSVTQRYQPNVGMTKLDKINTDNLAEIIPRITAVFEDACRYIEGHSQPLPTLGVSPTLTGLKEHWEELQDCKRLNDRKEPAT